MAFAVIVLTEPSPTKAPESQLTKSGIAVKLEAEFAAEVAARGYASFTVQAITTRHDKLTNMITHTVFGDAT